MTTPEWLVQRWSYDGVTVGGCSMDDADRGRSDLIAAILKVLPIDSEDGTCIVAVHPRGNVTWGDPKALARRILDALDKAYRDRELRDEWNMMVNAEREDPF